MSENLSSGVKGAAEISISPGFNDSIVFRAIPESISIATIAALCSVMEESFSVPKVEESEVINLLETLDNLGHTLSPNNKFKMGGMSHLAVLHFLRVSDTEFFVFDFYWQVLYGIDELGITFGE